MHTTIEPADCLRHLRRAVALVGGFGSLARHLGISSQAVWKWRKAPAERVLAIERATGGKVTRHELRPDLYPIDSGPHTTAEEVPTPGDGYRPVGVQDAPPPCDEAGRGGLA